MSRVAFCRALGCNGNGVRIGSTLFAVALAIGGAGTAFAQVGVTEAAIKAAIVGKLFVFVEWPEPPDRYRLCVAGRSETADAVLDEQGRMVKGQAIDAVRVATPDAVPGRRCKILFIAAGAGARAVEYAQAAAGSAILIAAEDNVLTPDRAHVVLTLDARRPVLTINRTDARRAGLDISSRLLQLARKVY